MEEKILTLKELRSHTDKNGVTLCRITEPLYNAPKDTLIYFNSSGGDGVSTFNGDVESKNKAFGHDFDYEFSGSWECTYIGKFIIVKEYENKDKEEGGTEMDNEQEHDESVDVTTFKNKNLVDARKKIEEEKDTYEVNVAKDTYRTLFDEKEELERNLEALQIRLEDVEAELEVFD